MTNKTLYQKLFEIQKEIKPIKKDSENPFFKSMYFDINSIIESIKPLLIKNGLVVLQPLTVVDGKTYLKTIIVDTFDGEQIESVCVLPDNVEPQKMGSAITYFRRYSLQSLLLLEAEDDDGNSTSGKNAVTTTDEKRKVIPAPPLVQIKESEIPF